jgi:3-deoxy-D-manno-octulosonate 8-phosphate phosphatase (KDO 8-P phosphatase)
MNMPQDEAFIKDLFPAITAFVLDMDGVLTDGTLLVNETGEELRTMNIKDGYAIRSAVDAGYKVFILSGATSLGAAARLKRLGCKRILMGMKNKEAGIQQLIAQEGLDVATTVYMGDDLLDLPAMRMVALPAAPADAVPEVYMAAKFVSAYGGGRGAVRDIIEQVMRSAGKWPAL